MKRVNHLIENIADPDNLRLAFWKARKGRSYSEQVSAFRADLDTNLISLRQQIISGMVQVGQYHYFRIFDPKERQICASAFSEQVLHHALMNVCHEHFEKVQIFHSYACRKGKGTYAALAQARVYTRRYPWYLKLDVRKFFDSIHHQVLKKQLSRIFKDRRLLDIFEKIIDSYEALPDRGMPIGNLTSQYFANHYLAGLDHFIKEKLGCRAYVRYMDDMVLWGPDKAVLKQQHAAVCDYVHTELLCDLKPEMLNRSRHGLSYLGYRIFPHQMRLTQRSKQRFIKKMKTLDANYRSGRWSEAACHRRLLPLLAFIRHADTKNFRKKLFLRQQGESS